MQSYFRQSLTFHRKYPNITWLRNLDGWNFHFNRTMNCKFILLFIIHWVYNGIVRIYFVIAKGNFIFSKSLWNWSFWWRWTRYDSQRRKKNIPIPLQNKFKSKETHIFIDKFPYQWVHKVIFCICWAICPLDFLVQIQ